MFCNCLVLFVGKENVIIMKKWITGALLVAWMVVIFLFSAQDSTDSSAASQSVSYQVASFQNRVFGLDKTEEQLMSQAESMQLIIRKGAHISEYALLAVLFWLHLDCYPLGKKRVFWLALCLTACYAASDELHQLFVPGRACRLADVCIDTAGGLLGILIASCFCQFWERKAARADEIPY